jgi:RNA polymerase sigma-70 factor (ECF subfamily)
MLWPQDSDASATISTDHPRSGSRRASARVSRRAVADRDASECSLVGRVMAGDACSFLEIVNRHHGSVLRIAAAWGHDAETAEQIARSAWCAILERLPSFDGTHSLQAWLLRVASERASARAPPCPPDSAHRHDGQGGDGSAFDREGRWLSSARPASSGATVADVPPGALHDAVATLLARERVALTLRDIEGLGPTDAAAVLGVTVAVQHALLHRARTAVVRQIWSIRRPTHETRRTARDDA